MQFTEEYFSEDGEKLYFSREKVSFKYKDFYIIFENIPYLVGINSKESYLPPCARFILNKVVNGAIQERLLGHDINILRMSVPTDLENKKFSFCKDFSFNYSALEYYFIPGLFRPYGDGFLTPVYFNLFLLDKYSRRPDYDIELNSSTYGYISYKGEWGIPYGINKNKSIVMWLGDIDKLPEKEKQYLLSENIEPEFEIHSEFYNAQIGNEWSEPSLESQTFSLRNKISKKIYDLYNMSLYQLEGEISKTISDLQKPIFWQPRHIASTIESLNRIFVESLSVSNMKSIIRKEIPDASFGNLKGLKIFTIYLSEVLKMESVDKIMCPFFVLADYRNGLLHLASQSKYQEKMELAFSRLDLEYSEDSHEKMYTTLFEEMHKSLEAINETLILSNP